jgi:hypothetical protein
MGGPSKYPIRCASTQVEGYFPKDPSECKCGDEKLLGLLHGDGVINMKSTMLSPFA